MDNLSKQELIKEILEDVKKDIGDEEVISLILNKKVAMKEAPTKYTFGQRAADKLAKIVGSWGFVIVFMIIIAAWIVVNKNMEKSAFDPYPFILLNLALSCLAAIQAPLIMMSQNRQEKKDRQRAENDYRVNLKTEIIIQDLYDRLEIIVGSQSIDSLSSEDESFDPTQPNR